MRVSYTKDDATGLPVVLEQNHYYPFGLKHTNYNTTLLKLRGSTPVAATTSVRKYRYYNKEYQDELGLNWYDYGKRNFDPAIGKFMSIDRYCEKYLDKSPYHYANNNPLIYVDMQGDSIKVVTNRFYNGTSTGSTTQVTSNNDLGETTLEFNSNGGTYNRLTNEVDATFNIRQDFSPFIDPNSNTKFKQANPGLAQEVEAHENGHAEQIQEELNNGIFSIDIIAWDGTKSTFSGTSQTILNNVYNTNETDFNNAVATKESYETVEGIRERYNLTGERNLRNATRQISNQASNNVATFNAADPGHSDANNRAAKELGGNVRYNNGIQQMVPCTTGNCN